MNVRCSTCGEPMPLFADLRVTRDLLQAGLLLKIEVLDHIVIGNPRIASRKQMGQL